MKCPICGADKSWMHVMECGRTDDQKAEFIQDIENILVQARDNEVAEEMKGVLKSYINNDEYDSDKIKQYFRGWIYKGRNTENSK